MKLSLTLFLLFLATAISHAEPSADKLAQWLKRFPEADTNKDGTLTVDEAQAYRDKVVSQNNNKIVGTRGGAPRQFKVDPGWEADRFPEHAVCYRSPEEIKVLYQGNFPSFPAQKDGVLRIVGTGHSFMAPGYRTMPKICEAAGFKQPLFTHTGGGMTGSTRYKWEQENGIFQFDKKPTPKLLAAISNASWDAMMWGPYFNDRPEYYTCWIDFCLKYNPEMKFYLSDAWLQLYQLEGKVPEDESYFTPEILRRLGSERAEGYIEMVNKLNETYPDKVYIMPTCDAMTLAAIRQVTSGLPGIEGLHKVIGKKERSLWRDFLGHIGPGFDRLEGYVFYATLYKKSPELIKAPISFDAREKEFPSPELDAIFRKIAWQAVSNHPLSGVTDKDGDGIGDDLNAE